jgi:arylsulfatase A-like enzyme
MVALVLAAVVPAACGGGGEKTKEWGVVFEAHRGPVVLITLDALRADAVTARLMPHFSAFLGEADWAGTGVAASSWTAPSMASLFTGLQPWRHGVLHPGRPLLVEELHTLPEAMAAAGFATAAYRSNHWLEGKFGYRQGFEVFRGFGGGGRAAGHLASLDGTPAFLWAHILPPHAPYLRHEAYLDRLDDPPADLPPRVTPQDLELFYDPATTLPPERRRVFDTLYRLHAAWADEQLGRLLDALRRSGHFEGSLIVVTTDHGEEFGEHGQIGHGGHLGRELLEVPLGIRLPRGFAGELAIGEGQRPGLVRLYATLVEAVGGEVPALAAPSLFRAGARPELSELYLGNGANELSLVDGDHQLRWTSRFAAPEPEFFPARLVVLGGTPARPLGEPAQAIFDRLESAFRDTRALGGAGEPPRLEVVRWAAGGRAGTASPPSVETAPVDDAALRDRLARTLKAAWNERNGPDAAPGEGAGVDLDDEDLEKLKSLGYIP